jgi:tyrosyl-tRNA synthetase
LIGDPSGKTTERPLISKEDVANNLEGIKEQLRRFLDFNSKTNPAMLVNNADWLTTTPVTDFLRDIGKHFTINSLVAHEFVKRRMEQGGISYTEFSYILLQAYDYLTLFERYNCTLQMGGNDQWGNITAGVDLIRRVHGKAAHALVWPLLLTASGVKFGKTERGSVWLDARRTSPYRMYQFFFNTDDRDVIGHLKSFTFLARPEIEELAASLTEHPEQREAQRRLAQEVTRSVHGDDALRRAELASRVLFGAEIRDLGLSDVLDIFAEAPSVRMPETGFSGEGMSVVDLLASSGIARSKGEARRLIEGGGVYLQNVRVADPRRMVSVNDAIEGQAFVLRKGQKEYCLVRVV